MEKDKELNKLIELFNKNFNTKIRYDELKLKEIVPNQKNSFLDFVSTSRFSKFFALKVIDKLEDYKFYLGNKYLILSYGEDEDYVEEDIGPAIILREFKQEEIFDQVLDNLAFEVVITTKNPYLNEVEWVTQKEVKEINGENQNIMIALTEDSCIIFFENKIYYYNLDIEKELEIVRFITKNFLDKKDNPTFIKHEEYITILLDLLPGKIKLRQLT